MQSESTISVATSIAERIKEVIAGLRRDQITELIGRHLVQLRLIDDAGRWQAEPLAALGDWLSGEDLCTDDALVLVDEAARCVDANPYLVEFLDRAKGEAFDRLFHKVQTEGAAVLPSVLTYGLLLERLTQAMRNDWRLIHACREIWLKARRAEDMKEHLIVFERAKVLSIDIAIQRVVEFHESGSVTPEFARVLLPMNIIEAMFEDIRLGNRDNAASAWPLVKDRPGSRAREAKTDGVAARWSEDRKAILLSFALPRRWADLYATWNLAFVSHYGDFPYLMTKLLIPQVNGYRDSPEEYLYNRLLALYCHLHHMGFGRIDLARQGCDPIDWHDEALTKLWSSVNRESAETYARAVKSARLGALASRPPNQL
ncbi:MAG: hypothetical protein KJO40_05235 [Deltaproteobacteria bacterium]|nr:hypothetical protein [Deltaproteobacteria bacterium]NND28752.1 hypothetical protein [Myxococcales bacterium]MBT8466285.1 hypothetical protein [Deltaproteobacteria bacterium]MBT8481496.1 hypothetical protein [Deltaproteobacteria bacterium]NNK06145.1 hypothetical protein [Myxococcales bacterium]